MPKEKKTHDDFRKAVCFLCLMKRKDPRNITPNDWEKLNTFFVSGLDPNDERLPSVLCIACRTIVRNTTSCDHLSAIEIFDYSRLNQLKPITRNSSSCECTVCLIGRSTPFNCNKENVPSTAPRGRPSQTKSVPSPIKYCSACLSQIAKGKPHDCTNSRRLHNLKNIIAESPPKTDEKVAAAIVVEKEVEGGVSLTREQGGKPLVLLIDNKKSKYTKPSPIKYDDFHIISQHLDHSVNKTLNLAKDLRSATKNRKIVCPDLRKKIEVSSHRLDGVYTVMTACLKTKVSKDEYILVETPVVYCTDMDSLLDTILEERCGNGNFELKLGVDGGGGFIKICLNIIDLDEESCSSTKRSRYSEGVSKKLFKSTSVRKLIVLALAPGVLETHENMFTLWTMLNVSEAFKSKHARFATDLKMANILLGLMSHSSCHPCSWCNIERYVFLPHR